MQEQTKRPAFPGLETQPTIAKPKDLLAEIPDISGVIVPPKRVRAVTRCAWCDNPNCRQEPVTIYVES